MEKNTLKEYYEKTSKRFWDPLEGLSARDSVIDPLLKDISGTIIEYVKSNPIMGSGFLGSWILTTVPENSAHSQYFDIFFRTGFLGFILWFLLTLKIIIRLYKIDKALFYGFLSIIIFGFFNETFKLSYGAFIYAFCLAYTFQYTNRNKLNYLK